MIIHLFSRVAGAAELFKARSLPEVRLQDPDALPDCVCTPEDLVYLDTADMDEAAYKKQLRRLKALGVAASWGVIDSADLEGDPAALFQDGAADFIGAALLRRGPGAARMKRVLEYVRRSGPGEGACAPEMAVGAPAFPGWSKIKPGQVHEFHFLYVGPENQGALKTRLGEGGFTVLRDRLKNYLVQALSSSDALVWMQSEASILLLLPAEADRSGRIVESCLRLLLNLPLVTYEQLGLELPLSLIFALHRGRTLFQAPGNTGTVVSEDVNFIFHLGAKKAEAGRLTLSRDALQAVPPRLADLFVPAGNFEGQDLLHSRRFL